MKEIEIAKQATHIGTLSIFMSLEIDDKQIDPTNDPSRARSRPIPAVNGSA